MIWMQLAGIGAMLEGALKALLSTFCFGACVIIILLAIKELAEGKEE